MDAIENYEYKLDVGRKVKGKFPDVYMNIVDRNLRKFKTATKYPLVVHEQRNFQELGKWYIVITAESKSRFRRGIIGISAFQLRYDEEGKVTGALLVEGDDDENILIEEYSRDFLEDFADLHGIDVVNEEYSTVFLRFYKENYFSTRKDLGGMFVAEDSEGNEHRIIPFIMATPVGVALGYTNEKKEGNIYFKYELAEDYFAGDNKSMKEISDRVLNFWKDMEDNPWKYSPLKNRIV